MTFADQYGPWALIAGASMGIGRAFSHEAASRGLNVVMVARGAETLEETASEVRSTHGAEVRTISMDLARTDVAEALGTLTDDLEIGLFVYNACVAPAGRFLDIPMEVHQLSVAMNCATPVSLCAHFGRKMVERGRGGIGMVSSNGGLAGAKNFSTYNAGKAFEWILAETLWAEFGEAGVHVNNIFVGPTASPNYLAFQETLDPELCNKPDSDIPVDRMRARLMDPSPPEEVATALLDQLPHGPVCWSRPADEWIGRKTLDMSRADATLTWQALQETSKRIPEKQAR